MKHCRSRGNLIRLPVGVRHRPTGSASRGTFALADARALSYFNAVSLPRRQRRFPWLHFVVASCVLAGCTFVFWPKDEHGALIEEVAQEAGVDAELVKAIVWHESAFDAGKQHDGGYGLMQIGAGTGIEWAAVHGVETFMVTDLLDARTNLQAGTWYLARALRRWRETDDAVVFALADYAAGPESVRSWAGDSKRSANLVEAIRGTPAADFVSKVLERARRR